MVNVVRPKLGDVLPGLMLYVINIYQPCTASEILKALAAASKGERVPKSAKTGAFVKALQWLIENNYVKRVEEKQESYVVSPVGLSFLSQQRLAFPRDKFRLYFLHQELRKGWRKKA